MKICIIINWLNPVYSYDHLVHAFIFFIVPGGNIIDRDTQIFASLISILWIFLKYFLNIFSYIYIRLSFFYEAKLRGIIFSRISGKAFEILKISRDSEKQKHFHLAIRHKNCRFSSWCFICPLFSGKCDIVAVKKFKRGRMQFVYLYALE